MPNAKPGSAWRFLSHRADSSLELQNDGVFDELVVDDWLHVEQMDHAQWWLRIGDARVFVTLLDDGRADVSVERGAYAATCGETILDTDKEG